MQPRLLEPIAEIVALREVGPFLKSNHIYMPSAVRGLRMNLTLEYISMHNPWCYSLAIATVSGHLYQQYILVSAINCILAKVPLENPQSVDCAAQAICDRI